MGTPKPRPGSKTKATRVSLAPEVWNAPPPWANQITSARKHVDSRIIIPPNEPQEVGLRRMREVMWGPVTDEEYAHRLKFGARQVRKFKITANKEPIRAMVKLKAARKRLEHLAQVVRTEAFNDWIASGVVRANRPEEWTQAAELYEGYVRKASKYGNNRGDKRLAAEELATLTAWGKMMGAIYPKKRRGSGQYYPLYLKKNA